MIEIGIYIYPDAEELDFVGPYEVFTMINEVKSYFGEPAPVNVTLISETGEDIIGKKGMKVGAHKSISDIKSLDVICIPGGDGSRKEIEKPTVIQWIKDIAPSCTWVTSVCTGSFILSKAGLTSGKRIATHWAAFEEFKKLGLEGELVEELRFVRDGNVVTSAGVSAGIDMALWISGQLFDPQLARMVQRAMQYDPAPPYTSEV